jgi:beta-fructofuranosidase
MQVEVVEGRAVLLFSCLRPELAASCAAMADTGGVWAVTAGPGAGFGDGPIDVGSAQLLLDDRFYVGRLVREREGGWVLLAFHNRGPDGTFVGSVSDPMRVTMTPAGLALA